MKHYTRLIAVALLFTSLLVASSSAEVRLQWFYTEGCYKCGEVKRLIAEEERLHAGQLFVERLDIADLQNYKRMMALERQYGISQSAAMEVFIGDRCLLGHDQILRDLKKTVSEALARDAANSNRAATSRQDVAGGTAATARLGVAPRRSQERGGHLFATDTKAQSSLPSTSDVLARLGPMVVMGAGLIDGLNPCAFATIVFLVSLLAARHFTPRQLLQAGLSFAVAVFMVNFLVGLGAFSIIHRMEGFRVISDALYWLIALGAIVLGVFSIKDALAYRREYRGDAMTLKLPEAARNRMHTFLREHVNGRFVAAGCFISGAVVAVLEVACTGQIYLPTIIVIARDPVMRTRGLGYLALYNIMFILPLLAVLGLMVAGVKWQRFLNVSRRSVVLAKILLAILFFILAGFMIGHRLG